MPLDIFTPKIDLETWRQLANIEFTKLREEIAILEEKQKIQSNVISNLQARLKILEDQKLPQAISILEAEARELKKKSLEMPQEKKFSIMDWFR
jgi:uncharacterized protein YqiB (DUF1249 family)